MTEKICLDMRVWDLINSDAFKKASNDTPIWYADSNLGYVKLGIFVQMMCEYKTMFVKEDGKTLTKKDLLKESLLILDFQLMISTDVVPLNTQGCIVVLEDCGIVINNSSLKIQ